MMWQRWDDYITFHNAAIASRDIDPVYPVLAQIGREQDWHADERDRAVLLHVAYYDMGSALTATHQHLYEGVPMSELPVMLPCATERRNHRQPEKLRRHLTALQARIDAYGTVANWLMPQSAMPPDEAFEHVANAVAGVWGNGRWASYKTAEMLWKVCGWDLRAATLAMDDASGPKQGLVLLLPPLAKPNENAALQLVRDLAADGHNADPEQVETTLCDFHSLHSGSYYVGHDIDQMQAQLLRAQPGKLIDAAWRARIEALPRHYLGELNGWAGTDLPRKRVYRESGLILVRP